jgi:hypothetical protein
MADPTTEAYAKAKAFRDLVAGTMEDLKAAATQSSLAAAIDARLAAWDAADADFAEVLRDLRGQAYSIGLPHLREIKKTLAAHLKTNLDRIDAELKL